MTKLQDLLTVGKPIIADGGMGTMLMQAGLEQGQSPELWNVEKPDAIRKIQSGYINAGAQIILTNTFGGNPVRMRANGLEDRMTELNHAAAQLTREVVDASDKAVVVGGSMGPMGEFMEPLGTISFDDAVAMFKTQAQALFDGGVDLFWIETMSALEEVKAAVTACRQVSETMPIVATMTFDTKGRTMMGVKPEQAVEAFIEMGVIAMGANCGNGPAEIETVIQQMHEVKPDAILIAKSNAGLPRAEGDHFVYDATPEDMATYAKTVNALGAQIVGACCGSTPEHIQAIATALKES